MEKKIHHAGTIVLLALIVLLSVFAGCGAAVNGTDVNVDVYQVTISVDEHIQEWGYQVKVGSKAETEHSEESCSVLAINGEMVQILAGGSSEFPAGWKVEASAVPSASCKVTVNGNLVKIEDIKENITVTVTARNDTMFTVTFDTDGGSEAPQSQSVKYGGKVTKPADPTKTGYTFDGWYYGSSKWNFNNDVVTSDMTLTAHWTPITYKVHFDANTGVGSMTDQEFTYDEKKQLTFNTFTKNTYSFQGWAFTPNGDVVYKNGEIVMNLSSVQDDVVNLYAVWKYTGGSGGSSSSAVSYCLVQFEPFTGQEIESQWLKEGSLVPRPEDPVNDGFVFCGWYTESGIEWDFATDKVYYSMTLSAKWVPEEDTPVMPGSQTTETTASSPIGVAGILAGLGAAAVLGLRRK